MRVDGLTRPGVVEHASFVLGKGDILGIAGLVGAGHTDLVRLIYGAMRITDAALVERCYSD